MSRSCDRIIRELRKHYTVHIFHFTNKFHSFFTESNIGGTYTALPVYEDSSHTLNVLWTFLQSNAHFKKAEALVSYGSHLCLRGLPQISQWSTTPLLTCFRGNDFDSAIFSPKKQHLLYAIQHSTAVACVTSEKVDRIKALKLNENVFFTPNSIDLEQWKILGSDITLSRKLKSSHPPHKIHLGFIGYLKQKKGIEFFLNGLRKMSLLEKVHLHFVGEVDEGIMNPLQQEQWSYSKVLPESQTQLMAHYLSCDAIVVPSIYDGMPNVILEAGALKRPIIASQAGGIPDVLSDETAYLFDALSEISMMEAVSQFLIADRAEIDLKCSKLYSRLQDKFTPEGEIENYLNIFKNLKS